MNQKYIEILEDYAKFMQSKENALRELQINGFVSYDTHKRACDSFGDILAKQWIQNLLNNEQKNILTKNAIEYNRITGKFPCDESVLEKIVNEMLKY